MSALDQRTPPLPAVLGWWAVTVLTLVVLDDLTIGPAFWALSRLAGPIVAVVAIYAVYVPAQIFLVVRGTSDDPGPIARFFLRRLNLQRRNERIAANEAELRNRIVSTASALLMTILVAGVLPPLVLWQRGASPRRVHRVAVATSFIYATEFALLHGFLPSAI